MTSTLITQQIQAEADLKTLTDKRDRQQQKITRATMKRNVLNRAIYETAERLRALKRVPEPGADVITFRKSFEGNGKIYTYAAIRTNTRWYVTGITGPNGVTWDALVDFIRRDSTLPFAYDVRLKLVAGGGTTTITPSYSSATNGF